jgi:hypothetical protein
LSAGVANSTIKKVDERSAKGRDSIMKRQVIICGVLLLTAISTCFAATTPARRTKTAQNEAAIVRLEKIIAEAFKNKQVETVKKYLAPEFVGLDAEGFKNVDGDLADIPEVRCARQFLRGYESSIPYCQHGRSYLQDDDAFHA